MADVVSGGTLTSGTAVTGAIGVANRDIAYTFAATSGAHVTFDVTASTWGAGTARLFFFNASNVLINNCLLTSTPTFCEFTPNSTGLWKVVLDPVSTAVGSATFTFANDLATVPLTAGAPVTTAITTKGQNANYTFTGTSAVHTAFGVTASTWSGATRLSFYNPAGTLFTYCNLTSAPSICELTPNSTGTWKAVLDPQLGAVGSATFAYANDQNLGALISGAAVTTSILSKGVNANGTFAAVSGKHVTFDVTAASWGTGSASLYFFRPTGGLFFNCAVVAGEACDFTPNVTGTWKVMVDPADTAVGSATFTFANDVATVPLTAGIAVPTAITIRGQNADYTFAGTVGAHETVNVTASNWGSGEANLSVYTPNGELYTYCVLTTGPTFCDFIPHVTGTWRLQLDPQGAAVGSTNFTLVHDQAKGPLTPNIPIATTISIKGQNANYTFAGTGGTPVTFNVTASNWGLGAATLNFYMPNGTLLDYCIMTDEPVQCDFTPNVTGTWKVVLDPYADAVGNATIKYHPN